MSMTIELAVGSEIVRADYKQDQLPAIPIGLYEAFMARGEKGMDALLAYMHLLYTYRRQNTNQVFALVKYLQKGLSMGRNKVRAARSVLKEMKLIADVVPRDEHGKIMGRYTMLSLLPNPGPTIGAESAPMEEISNLTMRPESGRTVEISNLTMRPENHPTVSDAKCLKKQLKCLKKEYVAHEKRTAQEYSATFETFWQPYPNRQGKHNAARKFEALLKAGVSMAELITARDNYAAYCKRTSWYTPQYAATFLGPKETWRDWLENEVAHARTREEAVRARFGR